jgi:CBS domain-containing protein
MNLSYIVDEEVPIFVAIKNMIEYNMRKFPVTDVNKEFIGTRTVIW